MPVAAAWSVAAGDDDRAAVGLEEGQENFQAVEEKNRLKKAGFGVTRGRIVIVC